MNPKEIEDQIKGLLGLSLGVSPVDSNSGGPHVPPGPIGPIGSRPQDPIGPPSRGPRPAFTKEGLQQHPGGFHPADQFGPPGLLGPIIGPFGTPVPTGPVGYVGPHLLNNLGPNVPMGLPGLGVPPLGFPGGHPLGPVGHIPGPELEIPQHIQPSNLELNIVNVEDDREEEIKSQKSGSVDMQNEGLDFVEDDISFMQEMEQELSGDNSEDFKPSNFVKDYLSGKYLYPLAHKSSKFPRARWFCRLCEYHCDNLAKCKEHYSDTRHTRLTRTKEVETTLYHLPRPTKHHIECLNSLLAQVEREQGIGPEEVQQRKGVALAVHNLLQHQIPGCTVRLYGSSLSGFGLKTSNVNLDLQITSDQKPHLALLKALDVLHESPDFLDIVDEFTAKIPIIRFTTVDTGLECELSLNNHNAYQTSSLLSDYWSLDPRIRTVGVVFRYWAHLTLLARQAEGTLPSHTFAILLVYYAMQQTKPLLPCIHDWLDDRNEDTYIRDAEKLAGWRTQNKMSPAELWIELFSFLAVGFNSIENVVSLRKSGITTNEEKQWKTKRLAVEDPFSPKRNLCRSIQAVSIYDYISDCLKTGYLYFGTIQTSLGPIISRIIVNDGDGEETEETHLSDWTLESWLAKKGTVLSEKEAITASNLVPRNMLNFQFDCDLLTNGTVPVVQCLVCGQEGHLPSQCPEEQLPPLESLPPLSHQHVRMLDNLCESVARDWEPQELELRDRDYIMSDLNRYIKKFWPKAELTLFGSSSNGFAFRHSDLDISLTFKGVETSEGLDCIKIIEELYEKVKRMVGMRNVVAITSAKVPIVKLFHQQCQVEADLSLYNVLARENTRLLSLYSDVDPRVRILGYMVKLYAKVCDIGDASRGSLSSYAYILMMIFYLQKCNPPVVPVLQELYPSENEKPKNMVDGWNAWFFSDRRRVVNEWPGYGRNRLSVGELWLGFLNFYAGQWDDKRLVVSIRQSRNLTKFEKMWNSPCIAIEDPFELAHNLGAGISRKMNLYIKKAFINGRKLYGTPLIREPPGYRTVQDYFFDPDLLTDGAPPNDRGCRACGKIGHLVADCPRKKAADARKKQQRQERQRSNSESTKPQGGEQQAVQNKDGGRNRTKSEIPKSAAGGRQQDMPGEPSKSRKIARLEKKRKKDGKLSKEESKELYILHKQVREEKRQHEKETPFQKSKVINGDKGNVVYNGTGKNTTNPKTNMIKDGKVNFDLKAKEVSTPSNNMINGKGSSIPKTKAMNGGKGKVVDVAKELSTPSSNSYFDYNMVPKAVAKSGVIDYLAPSLDITIESKNVKEETNIKDEKKRKKKKNDEKEFSRIPGSDCSRDLNIAIESKNMDEKNEIQEKKVKKQKKKKNDKKDISSIPGSNCKPSIIENIKEENDIKDKKKVKKQKKKKRDEKEVSSLPGSDCKPSIMENLQRIRIRKGDNIVKNPMFKSKLKSMEKQANKYSRNVKRDDGLMAIAENYISYQQYKEAELSYHSNFLGNKSKKTN